MGNRFGGAAAAVHVALISRVSTVKYLPYGTGPINTVIGLNLCAEIERRCRRRRGRVDLNAETNKGEIHGWHSVLLLFPGNQCAILRITSAPYGATRIATIIYLLILIFNKPRRDVKVDRDEEGTFMSFKVAL